MSSLSELVSTSLAAGDTASTLVVPIILAALGSGGIATGWVALRRSKVDNVVASESSTLSQMKELNDRLDDDNLRLRSEAVDNQRELMDLRIKVARIPGLELQVSTLTTAVAQMQPRLEELEAELRRYRV